MSPCVPDMAKYQNELREAACANDVETIKILISHNTNVNCKSALTGWTALHWASKHGNEEVIRLLISSGADLTIKNYKYETPADVCSNSSLYTLLGVPTTSIPAQTGLILKVRIAGLADRDYIEIEVPRWKVTYASLKRIFCKELKIKKKQVERIRKLPNVRLRNDSDVKRLVNNQRFEVALKVPLPQEMLTNGN